MSQAVRNLKLEAPVTPEFLNDALDAFPPPNSKKKCDELKPICGACKALGLDCLPASMRAPMVRRKQPTPSPSGSPDSGDPIFQLLSSSPRLNQSVARAFELAEDDWSNLLDCSPLDSLDNLLRETALEPGPSRADAPCANPAVTQSLPFPSTSRSLVPISNTLPALPPPPPPQPVAEIPRLLVPRPPLLSASPSSRKLVQNC
jgi:hypothetical protein